MPSSFNEIFREYTYVFWKSNGAWYLLLRTKDALRQKVTARYAFVLRHSNREVAARAIPCFVAILSLETRSWQV